MAVDYVSVAEARKMPGLRLALSAGTPGPWGEAAKAVLKLRNVAYAPVRQHIMEANEDLVEWTGFRNAPVAVYDDEPGVAGWIEILMLAERLGSGPSLLPDDELKRMLVLGICTEICSPGGFGWERRLTMMGGPSVRSGGPPEVMTRAYGVRDGLQENARARVIAILNGLSRQLASQLRSGSDYLVGASLTAADVYWACFAILIEPLPHETCPMSPQMRAVYANIVPEIAAAADPALLVHRDMVWQRHIGLPMEF